MLNEQIAEIAERIRGLRITMEISPEEMARVADVPVEAYTAAENGKSDFSFTFLYKCARRFGVDISELITGEVPRLSLYSIVRKGEGMPIERRKYFKYQHLAMNFRGEGGKISEPFLVVAKYDPEAANKEIHVATHEGEEFDYVLKGKLRVRIEDHIEELTEGDCIYYNSAHKHGMIALEGDCEFLAVVMERGGKEE